MTPARAIVASNGYRFTTTSSNGTMPCSASDAMSSGPVAAGEDAAVDLGVQRLEPAVHHLGKAGVGGHVADRDAGLFEVPPRAAAGEEFDARRPPARGRTRPVPSCR